MATSTARSPRRSPRSAPTCSPRTPTSDRSTSSQSSRPNRWGRAHPSAPRRESPHNLLRSDEPAAAHGPRPGGRRLEVATSGPARGPTLVFRHGTPVRPGAVRPGGRCDGRDRSPAGDVRPPGVRPIRAPAGRRVADAGADVPDIADALERTATTITPLTAEPGERRAGRGEAAGTGGRRHQHSPPWFPIG